MTLTTRNFKNTQVGTQQHKARDDLCIIIFIIHLVLNVQLITEPNGLPDVPAPLVDIRAEK